MSFDIDRQKAFTTTDTEDTEGAQRKSSDNFKFEIIFCFSLCHICALCVSVVSLENFLSAD